MKVVCTRAGLEVLLPPVFNNTLFSEPSKNRKASKVTRDGGVLEETMEVISCSS